MLYDPKWEKKTKADPFELHTLIAWLETMPANKPYCYVLTGHCLLAQYFTAQGFKRIEVGPDTFSYVGRQDIPLPPNFNEIARGARDSYPEGAGHTFGAALSRALSLLTQKAART